MRSFSGRPSAAMGRERTAAASSPGGTMRDTAEAGECAGGIGRAGDHRAGMQARAAQALRQAEPQRRLAAEQVLAAGDVEREAVRRIDHHDGRDAVAVFGDGVQQGGVGGVIDLLHPEIGNAGAGIGQRHARRRALPALPRG